MKIWIRLGLSVAILAIFAIIATEVFKRHPELHVRKKPIAAALAGAGTLLWLVSKVHGGSSDDFKRPDKILTMRFCGSLLGGFGAIITNIIPIQQVVSAPSTILHPAAREHRADVRPTDAPRSASAPLTEPAHFKVQGIIYRQNLPSAIVNGKTVFVGDRVGHAKVIAIEREAVTLETPREKMVVALRM